MVQQLTVITFKGEKFLVDVEQNWTVGTLRDKVKKEMRTMKEIRLVAQGKSLEEGDAVLLSKYPLKEFDTIVALEQGLDGLTDEQKVEHVLENIANYNTQGDEAVFTLQGLTGRPLPVVMHAYAAAQNDPELAYIHIMNQQAAEMFGLEDFSDSSTSPQWETKEQVTMAFKGYRLPGPLIDDLCDIVLNKRFFILREKLQAEPKETEVFL